MKKILYIALAVLALSACSKGSNASGDVLGGSNVYSQSYVGRYTMAIADELVAGALEELEAALEMGTRKITWASSFAGMEITPGEEGQWLLTYTGPFKLLQNSYETSFKLVAVRDAEPAAGAAHACWRITLNGNRTEREGYTCTFSTVGEVSYLASAGVKVGWNEIYGKYSLLVYRNELKVDGCTLSFNGVPSQAVFRRGL